MDKLLRSGRYYSPYQLSLLQRTVLTPFYAVGSILNPEKGDRIAALGDITADRALKNLKNQFLSTAEGRTLLERKPLLTSDTLSKEKLLLLSEDTLGKQYLKYMETHNFETDERSIVRFISDPDEAYILVRYRQVHDFWHVLAGLPPSVLGELALKAFEYQVTKLPVCLLSAVFGPATGRMSRNELTQLYTVLYPWAIRAGNKAKNLLTYDYERNLDKPIHIIRAELNIEPAPPF